MLLLPALVERTETWYKTEKKRRPLKQSPSLYKVMLQQQSSLFFFKPCLVLPNTKNPFFSSSSSSMDLKPNLLSSSSSSHHHSPASALSCRASREPHVTPPRCSSFTKACVFFLSEVFICSSGFCFHWNFCYSKDGAVHGLSDTIVGVLGGGQLGRMLCQAASKMAIKVTVLDPEESCPASKLAHHHMVGSFDDSATVQQFAKRFDFY